MELGRTEQADGIARHVQLVEAPCHWSNLSYASHELGVAKRGFLIDNENK